MIGTVQFDSLHLLAALGGGNPLVYNNLINNKAHCSLADSAP